jgi:tetratricopeptide (TPR) repeat protein
LEAFQQLLRVAVSHHYAPFLSHPRSGQLELFSDPELNMGTAHVRRGEYEQALRSFTAQARKQPGNVWALYNAALLQGMRGEESQALQLLGQARELHPGEPFASAWRRALGRKILSRRVVEPVPPSAPLVQAEASHCWQWESPALGDIRWSRHSEAELLADYHPGRCAGPGRACAISRYWIRFHSGLWSSPLRPGVDDEHSKPTYEGARQRAIAMFADHPHRYEYCVQAALSPARSAPAP